MSTQDEREEQALVDKIGQEILEAAIKELGGQMTQEEIIALIKEVLSEIASQIGGEANANTKAKQ